jgi:hypothetical protein
MKFGVYGFPRQIEDSPWLDFVLSKQDSFLTLKKEDSFMLQLQELKKKLT